MGAGGVVQRAAMQPSNELGSWRHTARCLARRRWVAFLGHAPGLYVLCGEGLPRALWAPQALAVAVTLAAMAAAAFAVSPWWLGTGAAWLLGHLSWSTYLALRLRSTSAGPCRGLLACDEQCGPDVAAAAR